MTHSTLQEKNKREQDFHDGMAESINLDTLLVRESFESPTAIENRYAFSVMHPIQGKKILDLGCGAGETSVYFAIKGADVSACDISAGFLGLAENLSKKHGVSLKLAQCAAEFLPWPDNQFDFVFGNGVLHHVDLEASCKEIYRVLRPRGKAVFIEPLPYNPVINIYRKMAKDVRTEDERPLTLTQIHSLKKIYSKVEHQEFWLFSLYLFIHFFLVKRWHPSKVRYWKKVIEVGPEFSGLFSKLQDLDHFAMKWLPFLRPLCWNTVIVAEK